LRDIILLNDALTETPPREVSAPSVGPELQSTLALAQGGLLPLPSVPGLPATPDGSIAAAPVVQVLGPEVEGLDREPEPETAPVATKRAETDAVQLGDELPDELGSSTTHAPEPAVSESDGSFTAIVEDGDEESFVEPTPAEGDGRAQDGLEPISPRDWERMTSMLLRDGRFSLAYWFAVANDANPVIVALLRALTFSARLRAPAGECAGAFRQSLDGLDFDDARGTNTAALLALGAGVPAALFSRFSGAANLLRAISPSFADTPELRRLVEAVIAASDQGVQIETAMVRWSRDLTMLEAELGEISREAAALGAPRTIRYARASDVWRTWMEPEGPLGSLLVLVTADDSSGIDRLEAEVLRLRDERQLRRLVDDTSRSMPGSPTRRPIEGAARQSLIKNATGVLDVAGRWAQLIRERDTRRATEEQLAWQQAPLDRLREAIAETHPTLSGGLAPWIDSEDSMEAGAAVAANGLLAGICALVGEGEPLQGEEPSAHVALGEELLKAGDMPLTDELTPVGELSRESLMVAAQTTGWDQAFAARCRAGDHDATLRIISIVAATDETVAATMQVRREKAIEEERAHLVRLHDEAQRKLDAARRLAHVSDDEWGPLYANVESLDAATTLRLGSAQRQLESLLEKLAEQRERSVRQARDELERLAIADDAKRRAGSLLDAGDVAAYQELVISVERGLPIPEPEPFPEDFERFFPHAPDALETDRLLIDDVIAAAKSGGISGPYDFSAIAVERRAEVAEAIEAFSALMQSEPKDQIGKLFTILRIMGWDGEDIRFEGAGRRPRGNRRVPKTIRGGDLQAVSRPQRIPRVSTRPPVENALQTGC
jgi:hypothetical protein